MQNMQSMRQQKALRGFSEVFLRFFADPQSDGQERAEGIRSWSRVFPQQRRRQRPKNYWLSVTVRGAFKTKSILVSEGTLTSPRLLAA